MWSEMIQDRKGVNERVWSAHRYLEFIPEPTTCSPRIFYCKVHEVSAVSRCNWNPPMGQEKDNVLSPDPTAIHRPHMFAHAKWCEITSNSKVSDFALFVLFEVWIVHNFGRSSVSVFFSWAFWILLNILQTKAVLLFYFHNSVVDSTLPIIFNEILFFQIFRQFKRHLNGTKWDLKVSWNPWCIGALGRSGTPAVPVYGKGVLTDLSCFLTIRQ